MPPLLFRRLVLSFLVLLLSVCLPRSARSQPSTIEEDSAKSSQSTKWRAGFAKVDITPTQPMRLSGYAVRKSPSVGVADPLAVRTAVLFAEGQATPFILISMDAVAIPGSMTNRLAKKIQEKWNVGRSRFIVAATHTHTAPHLEGALVNLFAEPLQGDELRLSQEYTLDLESKVIASIETAMTSVIPVRLEIGETHAAVSANRRLLEKGIWKGFGVQPDGKVDHRIQLCSVRDETGKLRSVFFQYACHATTIPASDNRVSADWPGMSASNLEKELDIVALPIIGCGADINPSPTGSYAIASQNSKSISNAIQEALQQSNWTPLVHSPQTEFGYAGLPSEHPTRERLQELRGSSSPHERRYADSQIELWDRRGVLPETYPAPIHVWSFGPQMTWIFLGGEVVLDYCLRLEQEIDSERTWVSSYCDDVFGYLASERMRVEGGYEVDESMIYYDLPGRWQTGTEELLIRRVQEIKQGSDRERLPLSPDDALKQFSLPDPYVIDLVASEPLVQDPVNFAFDSKGQLWVVEMRDYPLGSESGGCIKVLSDDNQDGVMDRAKVFLDRLSYPNSVFPYRDGAIVACVPDVFFAADRDGDGYAEYRETWLTGFPAANPQHRMNGFTYGLDGRLYMSTGEDAAEIQVAGSPEKLRASGRDLAMDLDSRKVEFVAGPTQFIRGRDDWNRWFGNANNEPMYQYVIEETFLARGRSVDSIRQFLTTPAVGPQVFPLSSADGRFNDVFSANRFTSACSSIICRTSSCGSEMLDAAIICEPVHNMVHRMKVSSVGAALKGERFVGEERSEWLRSSDPWFRPVRVETGPDGNIWIADMYRLVIEHPQWIPEAWQARVDLRAGDDKGRIYRVRLRDQPMRPLPSIAPTSASLLESLQADSGTRRDLAHQMILERRPEDIRDALQTMLLKHPNPRIRLQVLGLLGSSGWLSKDAWRKVVTLDAHPRVVQYALGLPRQNPELSKEVLTAIEAIDPARVDDELAMHLILELGNRQESAATQQIVKVARGRIADPWIQRSIMLSLPQHQQAIIQDLVANPSSFRDRDISEDQKSETRSMVVTQFVSRLLSNSREPLIDASTVSQWLAPPNGQTPSRNLPIAAAWLESVRGVSLQELPAPIQSAIQSAPTWLSNESIPMELRVATVPLLKWGESISARSESWLGCLTPNMPTVIQEAAFERVLNQADEESIVGVLSKWPSLGPAMRLRVTTSMLRQPRWILLLLRAIEDGKIRASDIDASSVQSMLNTWNREVQTRAVRIFGQTVVRDRGALVEKYLSEIRQANIANDAETMEEGKRIYQLHCAVCHDGKGDVPALGPNLTSLTDLSDRNLLTAILDPNRAVDGKFKQYAMVLDESTTLAGVIVSESSRHLIVGTADGKRHEVDRSSVSELKDQGISLMPEGMERQLPDDVMAKLLRYLQNK